LAQRPLPSMMQAICNAPVRWLEIGMVRI